MKRILTLLVAIFTITTLSYGQGVFTVQGGYSWTMGMVGGEYQIGHSAIGAGWMPTTMLGSGESLNSFSAYYSWSTYEYDESGYYVSLGFASAGYRDDDIVAPLGVVNFGYKEQWLSGFNLKGEVGFGWCEFSMVFTYGLTAGWVFGMY